MLVKPQLSCFWLKCMAMNCGQSSVLRRYWSFLLVERFPSSHRNWHGNRDICRWRHLVLDRKRRVSQWSLPVVRFHPGVEVVPVVIDSSGDHTSKWAPEVKPLAGQLQSLKVTQFSEWRRIGRPMPTALKIWVLDSPSHWIAEMELFTICGSVLTQICILHPLPGWKAPFWINQDWHWFSLFFFLSGMSVSLWALFTSNQWNWMESRSPNEQNLRMNAGFHHGFIMDLPWIYLPKPDQPKPCSDSGRAPGLPCLSAQFTCQKHQLHHQLSGGSAKAGLQWWICHGIYGEIWWDMSWDFSCFFERFFLCWGCLKQGIFPPIVILMVHMRDHVILGFP